MCRETTQKYSYLEEKMSNKTIGYVAVVKKKDGGLSSFAVDYQSGYSYFSDSMCIRKELIHAIEDIGKLKNMSSYYASDKHDMSDITVKRVVLEDMPNTDIEAERNNELMKKVKKNFTPDEIETLERILGVR
jgi:hypothetical protein